MTPEQAQGRAAVMLAARLVDRHGLTAREALTAVAQVQRHETGPHTHLVRAEATAVLNEIAAPFRALVQAVQPLFATAARAASDLLAAFRTRPQETHEPVSRRRPAWQSPYGPPPRHRR